MNLYQKIRNFIYIWKWMFVKEWHTVNEYRDKKGVYHTCKLKPGQVEGWVYWLGILREKKMYRLHDIARDRLLLCGSFWRNTVGAEQNIVDSFPEGQTTNKMKYTTEGNKVYVNAPPKVDTGKNRIDYFSGEIRYECYGGQAVGFENNEHVERFHYSEELGKSYLAVFPHINFAIKKNKDGSRYMVTA